MWDSNIDEDNAAVRAFGRIDVIINNAGLMPHSPLERRKIDDWDRTIDVNLKGLLYDIVAALPDMQQQKAGYIINVSSVARYKVGPGDAAYSATEAAVRVISEGSLARSPEEDLVSASVAQRIDRQGEGWRGLTAAWVVEVIP